VNRFINDAYAWIVKKALWPWRETTTSGGRAADDHGPRADRFRDGHREREPQAHWRGPPRSRHQLRRPDVTGSPFCYYIEGGNVVKTYPAAARSASATGSDAAKLAADGDVLIVPDEWVQLVIDRACYRGVPGRAGLEAAQTLKAEVNDALADMMLDELSEQADEPDRITVYGGEGM
jgi:hypothetical protein